ncbi:hypothetical protein [Streptomyces kanamyceticus]|uniref:Lipoprotein n=1 Tax=Streptomyces kanamyceticus TaxID=1967 RepID=A0A5J6GBS4_STRKN|nr:hypothetical protein [Streptomyces kanamyceticus]QEU92543.1 hypothetical protein CP970_17980 [Streptomyces kanamyceticus]
MNHLARLASAAVLTASTVLSLTACGGSGAGRADGRIVGADEGRGGSEGASPSADGAAGRPEITLPHTFQANFEGWANSDPKLQTILNDGKERLRAGYAAIIASDPQDSALKFYSTGATLKSGPAWVRTYKGLTLKGSVRISKPQVHVSNEGFGVLFYCVDEARGYTRNLKTDKVEGTPDGDDPKVQYRTRLDKNAQGVWQTSTMQTDRGGCDR